MTRPAVRRLDEAVEAAGEVADGSHGTASGVAMASPVIGESHVLNASEDGAPGDAVRRAEERIFRAIAAQDVAGLQAELAEDFVHSPIGGAEQDRSSFLGSIRDMPYRILELRGDGLVVRVIGDVAILSGVQRARVALPAGSVVVGRTAFVDVFVSSGTGWRLKHACSVELPPESPQ